LEDVIERIRQMEWYFDTLQKVIGERPERIREEAYQNSLQVLVQYYEGGQWQNDYELDEAGMLPKDLKRGVLSQDGLYDLICDAERELRREEK